MRANELKTMPIARAAAILLAAASFAHAADKPAIELKRDDQAGLLEARIDGRVAFTYHFGRDLDLPYLLPRGPSGKALTIVHPKKYPHHRSVWFADRVQLAGQPQTDFYNALYSRADKRDPNSPFSRRIRQVKLSPGEPAAGRAVIEAKLLWELDRKTPVLDEDRLMCLTALGRGEYLLDVTFTVTAGHGDVAFVSDAVHYAWPYIRMSPAYSVAAGGGTMTNSAGGVNQKGTHGKVAAWVDYSAGAGETAEGLAVLSHADNDHPHSWLTRDYGTFGPRRVDARSGKRFVLKKGKSLARRVGLLVHRGDVRAGKVAERYAAYVKAAGQPAGR